MFESGNNYEVSQASEDNLSMQKKIELKEASEHEYEEEYKKYEEDYREWIESNTKTYEEMEEDYRKWIERDQEVAEIARDNRVLQRFVRRYTGVEVDLSDYDIRNSVFTISFKNESFVPDLPKDYAYSGGAARSALERMLKIDLYGQPRDLDIVYAGSDEDESLSSELAATYMPDDYSNGFGVKSCDEDYFNTRDFTINEIYFTGTEVHCTKQCLLDTVRGIVRITEYEKKESYKGVEKYFVQWRLLAKALRFVVSKESTNRKLSFANEEAIEWEGIGNVQMVLNLDRAMGHSALTAERFVDELVKRNLLPASLTTPKLAALYLAERVDWFCFQHIDLSVEEKRMWNAGSLKNDVVYGADASSDDMFDDLILRESTHKQSKKISPMKLVREEYKPNIEDWSSEHYSEQKQYADKITNKDILEMQEFKQWCESQKIIPTKRQVSKHRDRFEHFLSLNKKEKLEQLNKYKTKN